MTLGQRIKRLRLDRGWTQGQLGVKVKAHKKQISNYERDVTIPSTELLIRMAKVFNVSLDYLAFDDRDNISSADIADREFLQKLAEIDKLSEQDKTTVKRLLDIVIMKNRFQQLAAEHEEKM